MQTTLHYADLGITPSRPGQDRSLFWRVTLTGGNDCHSFLFAEEPEDRAIEALLNHLGHTEASVTPPNKPEAEEFAGVTTAPEHPAHVGQLLDHIAHLDDEQIATVRAELNRWARPPGRWPEVDNPRLFFYGTLMSRGQRGSVIRDLARPVGEGTIRGDLYAVGSCSFPAFVTGNGVVHGEVWEAFSPLAYVEALRATDSIEGFRIEAPEQSMYLRERHVLLSGTGKAQAGETVFTYRWNDTWSVGGPLIRSGSWREFTRQQGVAA